MLAHELAHLARRDSLWLVGASLIERLFFFQPLNRLARRELETAAEYLSDEWAMRKTGSAVSLAKCLATVAEWIQASPLGVPVAGLAERRSLLVARISRLLDERLPRTPASRRGWAALAALGVTATIAAAPRVSQSSPPVLLPVQSSPPDPLSLRERGNSRPDPRPPSPERRGGQGVRTDQRGNQESGGEDSAVVNALIARLKDENAGVRSAAARSLGRLHDLRAVMPLIAVLADSDAEVRSSAIDALAELEDPRAIGPIAALLKDPVRDVKRNALGNMGEQSSVAAITEALGDANADVRQAALNALNNLRAPVETGTLIKLMTDQNADVRQRAAELAGERSLVATIPQLRRMIEDPRGDVREAATQALGHIADPAARQALQAALQSPDAKVRRAAAEALGQDP